MAKLKTFGFRFENLTTGDLFFHIDPSLESFEHKKIAHIKLEFFQPDVTDRSTCCNFCMCFAELKCFSFMNPEDLGPRITIFARRGDVW